MSPKKSDLIPVVSVAGKKIRNASINHRVVIIGGGFGGLSAALALKTAPVSVTLVDKQNFHLFQPLLYQVATGFLAPSAIAIPLRRILSGLEQTRVCMAEVTGIDPAARQILLNKSSIPYDTLIVAGGSSHQYFKHPRWEKDAPALKGLEDAVEIRRRIFTAFEKAEFNPSHQEPWLTFAVIGGGSTGVELAGTLCEIVRNTAKQFHTFTSRQISILLVEVSGRLLSTYPESLSQAAQQRLTRQGVTCLCQSEVIHMDQKGFTIRQKGQKKIYACRTILWAAGVKASPLGAMIAKKTGAPMDKMGRLIVEKNLTLPNHPEILVLGDMARFTTPGDHALPGVAPVAIQQGRYAARLIAARLHGKTLPAFHYHNRGQMTSLDNTSAVAEIKGFRLKGFFAKLIWLFVHLMMLVEFQNRLLVLIQWFFNFFTHQNSAQLIIGNKTKDKP